LEAYELTSFSVGSKTPHLLCFGHLGARRGCSSPLSAPGALEWAARAPTRCPQSAPRGCSSPHSVPPGRWRSKGLRKPARCPRMLQVAAQASARYPMCAQSGISSPCSVLQGALELPPVSLGARYGVRECYRTCRALATWALDRAGPAGSKTSHLPCFGHVGARMGCSSPCSVPPERSKGLLNPPLGAPRGARRGCSSPRSVRPWRSKRLLKPAQCPGLLQVAAQASAWYPMCAQSGISSPCSVLQGALELPPVSLRAREGVRECCSKSPKNTVYRALCHLPLLHPALPSGPQIVWPRIVRNASAHPC
jgi:hypothetical protein